jgi:restriction system protein
MAVPDFQTIMLPVLELTADQAEHSLSEVILKVVDHFSLSEEDRQELLPSGRQARLDNRVGWAVTYLRKTGLLERTGRGKFRITAVGLGTLSKHPSKIDMKLLSQFQGFQEFRKRRDSDNGEYEEEETEVIGNTVQTPDEAIEAAYQRLRANLAQDLLERLRKVEPKFFEGLVVDLLMAMGYGGSRVDAGQIVGKTGDGGIDGIINEDKLGLDVVYIQAKRWDKGRNIGSQELREFVGALSGRKANKGVYITTSTFTDDARAYVRNVQQKIVLIDGPELTQLMIDYEVGVATAQKYEVKRVDLDYFEGV